MSVFFFSSRRRHTRLQGDWSSDVCSSDLRPLYRVELSVLRKALDGDHFRAVSLNGEHRARLCGAAIDEDGACAALTGVAADVRAGEAEGFSQVLNEQQRGFDLV